ncbi:hypothetical protein [Rathayibacter sp. AY1E3]|uniref:hypothetical protein n=1 Tax=Rathayibacter sp. AY1E3 TaxID=2080551 RepID=UPI0015E2983C|nr:hypothetical protein [Rathayibacter sp. AY1E3]
MQLHRLSRIFNVEPWEPPSNFSTREVLRHRAPVDLVLLSKLAHGRTGEVVIDETVNLGFLEKGLRSCDLPDDWPPIIPNRGDIAPMMGTIYATLPAADQGVKLWGKV